MSKSKKTYSAGDFYKNHFAPPISAQYSTSNLSELEKEINNPTPIPSDVKTQFNTIGGGLSLQTPPLVNDYQQGNLNPDAYKDKDQFLIDLYGEQGKSMIGALPKIGGASVVGETAPVKPSAKKDKNENLQALGTVASNAMNQFSQAQANMSRNQYNQDYQTWQENGKYWFDPNSDLKPDIDSYMDQMPSSTEALNNQVLTKKVWGGEAAYIFQKGGEGAATGAMAGGGLGAIAGGLIGVVNGIFSWSAAENEDKQKRKQALAVYEQQLKEWTARRAQRMYNQDVAAEQQKIADANARKAEKKSENAQTAQNIAARRQEILNLILSAARLRKERVQARQARWA